MTTNTGYIKQLSSSNGSYIQMTWNVSDGLFVCFFMYCLNYLLKFNIYFLLYSAFLSLLVHPCTTGEGKWSTRNFILKMVHLHFTPVLHINHGSILSCFYFYHNKYLFISFLTCYGIKGQKYKLMLNDPILKQ